ncbi:hypothetical protein EVAR_77530_1 [Eumeta japonica]|uniref:Mariner Mos1 transposase n=1 Tax=Eumeta variegata TaxID=151549 RepID=A0A4C1T969_EUMVA|nr:hypothetical protein EVAR_77530_1 [Eumeta japonica]
MFPQTQFPRSLAEGQLVVYCQHSELRSARYLFSCSRYRPTAHRIRFGVTSLICTFTTSRLRRGGLKQPRQQAKCVKLKMVELSLPKYIAYIWHEYMRFVAEISGFSKPTTGLLQHDNARPYTAKVIGDKIEVLGGIELLPHSAFSLDLHRRSTIYWDLWRNSFVEKDWYETLPEFIFRGRDIASGTRSECTRTVADETNPGVAGARHVPFVQVSSHLYKLRPAGTSYVPLVQVASRAMPRPVRPDPNRYPTDGAAPAAGAGPRPLSMIFSFYPPTEKKDSHRFSLVIIPGFRSDIVTYRHFERSRACKSFSIECNLFVYAYLELCASITPHRRCMSNVEFFLQSTKS